MFVGDHKLSKELRLLNQLCTILVLSLFVYALGAASGVHALIFGFALRNRSVVYSGGLPIGSLRRVCLESTTAGREIRSMLW